MKTYRRHHCTARHRTFRTLTRCMIPAAAWVMGEGPVALIAWCKMPTVSLHADVEAAQESKAFIDVTGCGGSCQRRHEIVWIEAKP